MFGVYGIDVNARHLSLIADFMTRTGSYLPMSRLGMNDCASPFLQMSFETTSLFLTKAASEGEQKERKQVERRGVRRGGENRGEEKRGEEEKREEERNSRDNDCDDND